MALEVGEIFHDFKIIKSCDSGGYGKVYLAEDVLERRVALKVVEKPENFAAIERQLKEHFPAASLKVKAETSAKSAEQFDNDVDEIRKIFGEDIVIVE